MNDEKLRDKLLDIDYRFESISSGEKFRVNGYPSEKTLSRLIELIRQQTARAELEGQKKLLQDLSDCGELHHSVFDYRDDDVEQALKDLELSKGEMK